MTMPNARVFTNEPMCEECGKRPATAFSYRLPGQHGRTDIGRRFTQRLNQQLNGSEDGYYFCGVALNPDSAEPGECPATEVTIADIHTVDPRLEANAEERVNASELLVGATELAELQGQIEEQRAALEVSQQLELEEAIHDFSLNNEEVLFCLSLMDVGVNCADYLRASNGTPTVTGNEHVTVNGGTAADN